MKKRKGNLAVILMLLLSTSVIVISLLTLVFNEYIFIKEKTVKTPDDISCFAMCDVCANAFKNDFEAATCEKIISEFTQENFTAMLNESITTIESTIITDNKYVITNPYNIVNGLGIINNNMYDKMNELTESATLDITLKNNIVLNLEGSIDDNGNSIAFDVSDIEFTIKFITPAQEYVQTYILTGEKMNVLVESETHYRFSIIGDESELTMQTQEIKLV